MNNLLSEINALYIRTNELQTFGVGIKTKEILKKSFRRSVITDIFLFISSDNNFLKRGVFFL